MKITKKILVNLISCLSKTNPYQAVPLILGVVFNLKNMVKFSGCTKLHNVSKATKSFFSLLQNSRLFYEEYVEKVADLESDRSQKSI